MRSGWIWEDVSFKRGFKRRLKRKRNGDGKRKIIFGSITGKMLKERGRTDVMSSASSSIRISPCLREFPPGVLMAE